MALTRVWIDRGCISCANCEALCPEVFKVYDISTVRETADIQLHQACIKQAARQCPLSIIKYSVE